MVMKILRLDRDENHIVQDKEQVKITLQATFMTTKSYTKIYQVQEQLKIFRQDWGDKLFGGIFRQDQKYQFKGEKNVFC